MTQGRALSAAAVVLLGVVAAVGGVAAALGPAGAARGSDRPAKADRVLIVSLPRLSWSDVRPEEYPKLSRLLSQSAIADLSTRGVHRNTKPSDSYVTLGAGARAVGDPVVTGQAFAVSDRLGADTVGELFARRTGRVVERGIVDLGIPRIVDANEQELFDAAPGSLGDTLAKAGRHRAVIANADTVPDAVVGGDVVYGREAVAMFMSSRGTLPHGRVDDGLLTSDPAAPFGIRQDAAAVLEAFDANWRPRSVVLVEASDLERLDAYRDLVSPDQRDVLQRRVLRATDELVGELLRRVDPERDAVLVIGPTPPRRTNGLTVAGLRAPGVEPGLLRSSTTRRSGFVNIVDVAPTVLDLVGLDRPDKMEGRPFERGAGGGSYADRRESLVSADANARFRDAIVGRVSTIFVIASVALSLLAMVLLERAGPRSRRFLEWSALLVLGMLVGTYLSVPFDFASKGTNAYWLFVVGVGAAFAAGCRWLGRRGPLDPLTFALGLTVAVHLVDALTGGRLEFNAAYGYTPTVGIRYAGIGNMTFSIVSAAVVIFAGLVTGRFTRDRGRWIALGALLVTFVVMASPLWGQDFGSALALAPSFALLGLLLFERRVQLRHTVLLALGLVASGLAFGFLDLLRPSDQRTHVGRFFEKVGKEGWGGFSLVIRRKLGENAEVLGRSLWLVLIPVGLAFIAYLVFKIPSRLRAVNDQVPPMRPALAVIPVLALLGFALNDSGIAIPGMMLVVVNASLVYTTARLT